jgi:hypothetical protein
MMECSRAIKIQNLRVKINLVIGFELSIWLILIPFKWVLSFYNDFSILRFLFLTSTSELPINAASQTTCYAVFLTEWEGGIFHIRL